MVFGKKMDIFDWEWGRNSALRYGQKIPCDLQCVPIKLQEEQLGHT